MQRQTAKVMYTKLGLCRLIELKQEYATNRDRYVDQKSESVSKACVSSENVEQLLKQDESNIKEAIYQVIFLILLADKWQPQKVKRLKTSKP
jgi:hypothetical protein